MEILDCSIFALVMLMTGGGVVEHRSCMKFEG